MTAAGTIEGFRLSAQQRGLWRRGDPAARRAAGGVVLDGPLDRARLRAAAAATVAGHEILRTTYPRLPGMELPVQVVGEAAAPDWTEIDDPGAGDADAAAALEADARRPLDLENGPAARFTLRRLGPERHLLTVAAAAAAADRRGLENLLAAVLAAYAGGDPVAGAGSEVDVQYADFAEWQSSLAEDGGAAESLDHWRRLAAEPPPPLAAELAGAGDGGDAAPAAAAVREIPPAAAAAAAALAAACGTAVEDVYLAAWLVYLARLGGTGEAAAGVLWDGRAVEQLEPALGLFARYLPVVCRLGAGWQAAEAVGEAARARAAAEAHGELYGVLNGVDGEPWRPQALFEVHRRPAPFAAAGLGVSWLEPRMDLQPAALRLAVELDEAGGRARLERRGGDAGAAVRLLEGWLALLSAAVSRPETRLGALPVVGEAERGLVVEEWNRTEAAPPAGSAATVDRLISEQAARRPDAAAVVAGSAVLSYGGLWRRAGAWAARLAELGLEPEERVGLLLGRGVEQVAAALGVLRAGGAFVALDLGQPEARLASMLDQAGVRRVIAAPGTRLPGGAASPSPWTAVPWPASRGARAGAESPASRREGSGAAPPGPPSPRGLAYGVFTSGSTGSPKGVLIEHASAVNLVHALEAAVYRDRGEELRVSLNAPLSFDAAVKQLVQLGRGRTLWVVPEDVRADGEAFAEWLSRRGIEALDCTPSQLRLLVDAGWQGPGLVLAGGEALPEALAARLAATAGLEAFNVYGPSECTVDASAWRVTGGEVSLGSALGNVRLYVVDRELAPVPLGMAGELAIGGAGVGRGYARRPGETAARFVPDPFASAPGGRLYRTGDKVRREAGGELSWLGRLDGQVKLRGFRIEVGEIEAVLAAHAAVDQAAVALRADAPGVERLVAYAVPRRRPARPAAAAADGRPRLTLPDGTSVAHHNRNETEYLYQEIFVRRAYAGHGLRLPEEAVVLDVGANIGMFALFVARHRPRARIFSFEPLGPLFATLEVNAAAHAPGTRVFPFGLGEREATASFAYYPRYTMMSGRSAYADPASEVEVIKRYLANQGSEELLREADDLLAGRFDAERHEVRLRPLGAVIRELGLERVHLLKIDVQRAEMDVLAGLDDAAWAAIDQLVLEVHDAPGEATEGRLAGLAALLEGRGFRVAAEQDPLLAGTDRHTVTAVRRDREVPGAALDAGPPAPAAAAPALDLDDLRRHARERLPEPLVPGAWVVLDALPMTARGKLDRARLPAPDEQAGGPAAPPETPFEEVVADLFADLLGVPRPGPEASFFDLGGHSLLATQLAARLRDAFAVELPLRALFDAPTVRGLAARVQQAVAAGHGVAAPPLAARARAGDPPLSAAQRRLWFVDQLAPGQPLYNLHAGVRLRGALDVPALARSLTEVVRRHEVLRTRYPTAGDEPVQRIEPPGRLPLPLADLAALPAARRDAELGRIAEAEAERPFDLARGPVIRAALARAAAADHALLLTLHHVAGDAWSMGLLVREVRELYAAFRDRRPSPLPELPLQYADFALWQREALSGEALRTLVGYWRRHLGGAPAREPLPGERDPGGRRGDAARGAHLPFTVPAAVADRLAALGRRRGATRFMVLFAAFAGLLGRETGRREVTLGTDLAGRGRRETEGLIGFFINMLPLRVDLSGAPSFAALVDRVREVALGAYAHQDLPFDRLVEEIRPQRDGSHSPLFRAVFVLQNAPLGEPELPGLELALMERRRHRVRFDLSLWMTERAGELTGVWRYALDLFPAASVAGLAERYQRLLAAAAERPEAPVEELLAAGAGDAGERDRREAGHREALRGLRRRPSGVGAADAGAADAGTGEEAQ